MRSGGRYRNKPKVVWQKDDPPKGLSEAKWEEQKNEAMQYINKRIVDLEQERGTFYTAEYTKNMVQSRVRDLLAIMPAAKERMLPNAFNGLFDFEFNQVVRPEYICVGDIFKSLTRFWIYLRGKFHVPEEKELRFMQTIQGNLFKTLRPRFWFDRMCEETSTITSSDDADAKVEIFFGNPDCRKAWHLANSEALRRKLRLALREKKDHFSVEMTKTLEDKFGPWVFEDDPKTIIPESLFPDDPSDVSRDPSPANDGPYNSQPGYHRTAPVRGPLGVPRNPQFPFHGVPQSRAPYGQHQRQPIGGP